MSKGKYILNTGRHEFQNFNGELQEFRRFLYKNDKTLAKRVLLDWAKGINRLDKVLKKMELAWVIEFGKRKGNL